MSKRRPGTQLTHDNWDEEEESEEAGSFSQATKAVLEKREIKKAKRKGPSDQSNGESKPSVFKGFTGFAPTSATTAPSFNFKPTVTTTSNSASPFGTAAPNMNTNKQSTADQTSKYLHQLKSLNQSVSKWISEHVDKNPYCILTPIFNDYEKHLAELEKKYPDHSKERPTADKKTDDTKDSTQDSKEEGRKEEEKKDNPLTSPPTTFTFGAAASSNTTASNSATSSSLFSSFSNKPIGTSSSTTGIFGGFGSNKSEGTTPSATSGFTFAVNKTGSNASTSKGADGDGEEEEYVPPKNEVEAIKEDDAFYTKRCKLYYKKGETWADRGVGNLYLKKCEDKTVLLVRADTALGNILLNILLSTAIPANRQGKNNVMISCVPNPPIDEKNKDEKTPVSMLLRVKTAEDADELFEKIKEAKES